VPIKSRGDPFKVQGTYSHDLHPARPPPPMIMGIANSAIGAKLKRKRVKWQLRENKAKLSTPCRKVVEDHGG
jgi:hypothetical protein